MIIPPIGGLGAEAAPGHLSGVSQAGQAGSAAAAGAGEAGAAGGASPAGGGFEGALTEAVSSLEQTQNNASSAAQALATGTVADPESAVVTVENAQLAMELASQIRTKATEATNSIFNTQV
jgi:flagellar hook-basal body complex protein FliE